MRTGVIVAIAAGLIGLGLLLGFIPGSAKGYAGQSFSCGSPWVRSDDGLRSQRFQDELGDVMSGSRAGSADYQRRCDDALDTRGVFAWILTGLGAVALIGVAIARRPQEAEAEKPSAVEPSE